MKNENKLDFFNNYGKEKMNEEKKKERKKWMTKVCE